MKNRILIRILSLVLLLSFALSLFACGETKKQVTGQPEQSSELAATDLMAGIVPRQASGEPSALSDSDAATLTAFAVSLFQAAYRDGQNNLISPLSVLSALAMTANGANGETLAEMERVFGMDLSRLNACYAALLSRLPQGEKYKLSLANSIWFNGSNGFEVNRDFLQTNADYYRAAAYRAPFDESTLSDINNWVKDKTDGMIPEILDSISPDSVMILVNALAFVAEWQTAYAESQIHDSTFTRANGKQVQTTFLYGDVTTYLSDGKATGFLKYYSGRKYAFVALLPNEGVSLSDYVATLDGAKLRRTLIGAKGTAVMAAIPKFQVEDSLELSTVLKAMGMTDAFDSNRADFTGLGTSTAGNIFINRVLHKTFLSLDERGTKAGAATVVEMTDKAMSYGYRVELDRPFVYLLIETESYTPFFIGTMVDPG